MRWFGVTDAEVIQFWKILESIPKTPEHDPKRALCHCGKCETQRRIDWVPACPGEKPYWSRS